MGADKLWKPILVSTDYHVCTYPSQCSHFSSEMNKQERLMAGALFHEWCGQCCIVHAKRDEQRVTICMQMSAQHADMCRALHSMGMEYVIEDVSSGYAVDIAIPSLRIAVEIDGPRHFARNADRRLGPSAMKHRHLSNRGWRVFSVTAQDWATASSSITALSNLRKLIAEQRSALQD